MRRSARHTELQFPRAPPHVAVFRPESRDRPPSRLEDEAVRLAATSFALRRESNESTRDHFQATFPSASQVSADQSAQTASKVPAPFPRERLHLQTRLQRVIRTRPRAACENTVPERFSTRVPGMRSIHRGEQAAIC